MPPHIDRPAYHEDGVTDVAGQGSMIGPVINDAEAISRIRRSCALAADILQYAGSLVGVGKFFTLVGP